MQLVEFPTFKLHAVLVNIPLGLGKVYIPHGIRWIDPSPFDSHSFKTYVFFPTKKHSFLKKMQAM